MVEPFSRTPMAMTASNGLVEGPDLDEEEELAPGAGEAGLSESMRERRLVVDASMEGAALDDWTLEPSMSLAAKISDISHFPLLVMDSHIIHHHLPMSLSQRSDGQLTMSPTHFCHANGNSKLPGMLFTTIFSSLTPCSLSFLMAPLNNDSMTDQFQRA